MENQPTNKQTTKQWLQRLKDESWEAELLVSAIAIFGTFKLFGIINSATNTFIDTLNPDQYLVGYGIVFFGLFAISILTAMFVIHFFLRAYWIGLVGLNSVFPDYDVENSTYSKIYTEKIVSELPKIKESINSVDDLCSVIFSVAFTFLFMYMYMAISASIYLVLFNLLSPYIPTYILLIPLFLMAFLMTFQMAFTGYANMKANKENEKIQIRLYKLVKLVSIVTYGPFYKTISQVLMIFGSNFKKKKRMVILVLSFIIGGACIAIYQIRNTNIPYLINHRTIFRTTKVQASYYEHQNKSNDYLVTPEIQSDIITDKLVKVFIPIFKYEKRGIQKFCNYKNETLSRTEEEKILLECYKKHVFIKVNDQPVTVDFLRYYHHRTEQNGLITYIKVAGLPSGQNSLFIEKKSGKKWEIPFYKP